ncbi:MAG: glutathione-dependent formaldehyde dehydrogenase [Bdellovibrionales bacterium RIFOXYC1_FULL_54_43]|nr:MAG: glutathione-dependent formaldehyde dehydrogenase [Bdellovibrionales bacterium RIFOXYC1_FULL_54_43]OFZ78365.1 MAG: glutathione-dependent formaldehyde dehydrogenase [Bdellovibrionales bacterium RIFOXYD1_FULL_55_31]
MRAVVFRDIGDIRLENVPEPKLEQATDAIVRLTASAICGTDLHLVRGTVPGMNNGTILGHEGVGVVEEVGSEVRNFKPGDRVVIPSTIACGNCSYCRAGYFSQCDQANPNGKTAGTAFYGGPRNSGPFNGLQAEFARIPFANVGLVKLPEELSDDEAILLSDILPTAYFGALLAEIKPGDTVAIFGCGPVGQLTIACARHFRTGRIIAVDSIQSRLELARAQGAEIVNYDAENPVEAIMRLTGGIGVDRAIDAVGVDANCPHHGPAEADAKALGREFKRELSYVAPNARPRGDHWHPGDAPTQALRWSVESLAKAGTLSIIGVYPETLMVFPIGKAMNKNLTLQMGNCNHRKYIPELIELVEAGMIDPSAVLTNHEPFDKVLEAYAAFDTRQPGWVKVKIEPEAGQIAA